MDDRAAADFEAFVAASSPSLLRTAWLLTADAGHAEDIVQTTLERVAQKWSRASGNPQAYAHRCLVNLAADRSRRRRARVTEVPVEVDRSVAADPTSAVDARADLVAALRRLPERQRVVLVLRYFLDLDEASTADALGVSLGTVKSSASRGLARLREVVLTPEVSE